MKLASRFLIALVLLAATANAQQQSEAQPAPSGVAQVLDFKGSVTAQVPLGVALPVRRGQILVAGTIILTAKNSSVVILLLDGSQVLVKENSRLQLQQPDELHGWSYLQMAIGELIAKVKKRFAETPPFRMGTPSAVITVRGTQFEVQVNKKGDTEISVHEGIVEVTGIPPIGGLVNVEAGFGTRVQFGHQPEAPYSLTISQFGNLGILANPGSMLFGDGSMSSGESAAGDAGQPSPANDGESE